MRAGCALCACSPILRFGARFFFAGDLNGSKQIVHFKLIQLVFIVRWEAVLILDFCIIRQKLEALFLL